MYLANSSTNRLTIRPVTSGDITAWAEFFENNDGLRFFNFDETESPDQKSRLWIEKQLWRYESNLFGLMALVETKTGALVGQGGLLVQEVDGKQETEIGYHVLPKYQGLGYATEAAQFFKQFAFDNNLADSVISIIHIHNIRSQKVAEKNGMRRTLQTEFQQQPVYIYRARK